MKTARHFDYPAAVIRTSESANESSLEIAGKYRMVVPQIARFLGAIYNGYEYSFNLIDSRALDTELANACLAI
jgi:hypothetical protein